MFSVGSSISLSVSNRQKNGDPYCKGTAVAAVLGLAVAVVDSIVTRRTTSHKNFLCASLPYTNKLPLQHCCHERCWFVSCRSLTTADSRPKHGTTVKVFAAALYCSSGPSPSHVIFYFSSFFFFGAATLCLIRLRQRSQPADVWRGSGQRPVRGGIHRLVEINIYPQGVRTNPHGRTHRCRVREFIFSCSVPSSVSPFTYWSRPSL